MRWRDVFIFGSWWGKLIGAFLGYLILGPAGALFGILIGNFFDRGLVSHFSHPYWLFFAERRTKVQAVFFKSCFSVLGHLAKASGRVSERDILFAKRLMQEMSLNTEQKQQAIAAFTEGKNPNFNLSASLLELRQVCQDNPELLRLFLEIQFKAAQTDGLNEAKITLMNRILSDLGFAKLNEQHRFYESYQAYGNSGEQRRTGPSHSANLIDQAYAILGLSPSATEAEVKKAYRKLMSKNHPDKLIAQGLPEAMVKIANEKTQKISKAYEDICKYKFGK